MIIDVMILFNAEIDAGGQAILVSHNIVKCMDQDKPAFLYENVHKILRDDLNFSGVVIIDDLAMDAVKTYVENGNAAVQAVLAGNDMIISFDFASQKREVLNSVNDEKISVDLIVIAVRKILSLKCDYKIIT